MTAEPTWLVPNTCGMDNVLCLVDQEKLKREQADDAAEAAKPKSQIFDNRSDGSILCTRRTHTLIVLSRRWQSQLSRDWHPHTNKSQESQAVCK